MGFSIPFRNMTATTSGRKLVLPLILCFWYHLSWSITDAFDPSTLRGASVRFNFPIMVRNHLTSPQEHNSTTKHRTMAFLRNMKQAFGVPTISQHQHSSPTTSVAPAAMEHFETKGKYDENMFSSIIRHQVPLPSRLPPQEHEQPEPLRQHQSSSRWWRKGDQEPTESFTTSSDQPHDTQQSVDDYLEFLEARYKRLHALDEDDGLVSSAKLSVVLKRLLLLHFIDSWLWTPASTTIEHITETTVVTTSDSVATESIDDKLADRIASEYGSIATCSTIRAWQELGVIDLASEELLRRRQSGVIGPSVARTTTTILGLQGIHLRRIIKGRYRFKFPVMLRKVNLWDMVARSLLAIRMEWMARRESVRGMVNLGSIRIMAADGGIIGSNFVKILFRWGGGQMTLAWTINAMAILAQGIMDATCLYLSNLC